MRAAEEERRQKEAQARAQREAEAKKRQEADAKAKAEAEAKAKKEAEARDKQAAEAKKQAEAEAKVCPVSMFVMQMPTLSKSSRQMEQSYAAMRSSAMIFKFKINEAVCLIQLLRAIGELLCMSGRQHICTCTQM